MTGGPSAYNDGKGISVTTQFSALAKRVGGAKHRKNAAAPKAISKIFFIHEEMEFLDVIAKIIFSLNREDLFDRFNFHAGPSGPGKITCAPFDLHYTISRTTSKNIQLLTTNDFNVMMEEVKTKARPALLIGLVEKKVRRASHPRFIVIYIVSTGHRREWSGF